LRHFALLALGWTNQLVIVSTAPLELPPETHNDLVAAGIRIERAPVKRLHSEAQKLKSIELEDGTLVPCDFIFTHPHQRQVPLVAGLELTLDEHGYVQVDPMSCETSRAGIYEAGDLTTRGQAAVFAAAAGMRAAAAINAELTAELATSGELKRS
jgi:thioredoxin reductase